VVVTKAHSLAGAGAFDKIETRIPRLTLLAFPLPLVRAPPLGRVVFDVVAGSRIMLKDRGDR